jgi:hypothetical protein|tara:strand:+ start:2469 stop:2936 length:468 start_codon:yes stop_codon:yes gene_type:complete
MNLAQSAKIVPVLEPQDHAAGVDCDSVSTSLYNHFAFIILFGELTGDSVLTVNSGATAGTKTTAETFRYRATAIDLKSAGGDTLGAEATSAALTLTAATYEDRMLVVEIDADELTAGQEWITVTFSSAASELFVSVSAIGLQARYLSDIPPTAIS